MMSSPDKWEVIMKQIFDFCDRNKAIEFPALS